MDAPAPLFDAHLHPEGLSDQDLESMYEFGLKAAVVAAHHGPVGTTASKLLSHFDDIVGPQLERLARAGIRGYAALGLHPQALPRRGAAEVLSRLPEYFRGGKVVAIGEVGLHHGGGFEEEVFVEQLQLARRLKLPVMVHTPQRDKERMTKRALTLIRESQIAPGRVLMDHASARTLPLVIACGHHAGLTIHPEQLRAELAVRLIRKRGSERLILNTEAGDGATDILALARVASLLHRAKLSERVISRVAYENAQGFFRLKG
jgi:predicted metal-dependent TIM-barrel fold hydrolase